MPNTFPAIRALIALAEIEAKQANERAKFADDRGAIVLEADAMRWRSLAAQAQAEITGAPELLAALKMARECIAYCRRAHKDAQYGEGIPVEIFLDAAIAKATGAQS